MTNTNNTKILNYKKTSIFNIGTIIFGCLFIYMIIYLFIYMNTKHITAYEVTAGPLAGNYQYTAIAVRTEQIVTSDETGKIDYYVREGTKVGKGNNVCAVGNDAAPNSSYPASNPAAESNSAEVLSFIRSEISSFSTNYNATTYQGVYNFKSDLESSILEMTSENTLLNQTDDQSVSETVLPGMSTAPEAGVVIYSIDGYEDLQATSIKASDFEMNSYSKENLRLNRKASNGKALYKLITDEHWSLVFPLDDKMVSELSDRTSIRFRFLKDGVSTTGAFSIIQNSDGTYGKIDLANSMVRYDTERYLEIELILNRESGLKIPKSAIEQKSFYKIPKVFASYDEDDTSEIRILKQVQKKDGSFTTKTITATVYDATDQDFYVEDSVFEDGDVILKTDSSKQYTIGKKKDLQGVYNINKGYAVFREINIIDENEEYCIVEEGSGFGLAQYDHIALDASSVNDQDIIYK